MKKRLKILAITIGLVSLFLVYVEVTYRQKFEVPVTGIRSSLDSSIVARGRYLVLGPSHCYSCHTNDSLRALKLKEPLMGGNVYKTPFGDFHMPNITMDKETGIGLFTDEQLARAIRYNLSHENEAMAGFMSFNNMSDSDLKAVVSYLRTTTPVRHEVPDHSLNLLGKTLKRFLIKPFTAVEVSTTPSDTTAEYGKYIAYTVAQCNSCHTKRNKLGQFVGEPFAGGFEWDLADGHYTSPNLTPDDSTGHIFYWTEEIFIERFRGGRIFPGSPMPWEAYEEMSESDLKALFAYLKSLPAKKNKVGLTHSPKVAEEEELTER